ncbi:hypothetical protein RB195_019370 [Necator americanus]|uniref:ER membrane protein complex subunit 1 n=1 Tax=Necator americanus TaxID=51031 RepID=A0ABR1CEV9_NECAM
MLCKFQLVMKAIYFYCLICILLPEFSYALFEDQVGKFDWRLQYVGCPHKVHFDTWGKSDRLLMSTRENVFASLSANSGQIVWRRIQEDVKGPVISIAMEVDDKALYTISAGGRVVRVWNKRNGALLWQKSISEDVETSVQPSIVLSEESVIVANSKKISCFSKNGDERWARAVPYSQWSIIRTTNTVVRHLSIANGVFTVEDISLSMGEASSRRSLNVKFTSIETCAVVRNFLICGHDDSLLWVDFTSSSLNVQEKKLGCNARAVDVLNERFLLTKCSTSASVFDVLQTGPDQRLLIPHQIDSAALNGNFLVAVSGKTLEVFDMTSFRQMFKTALPFDDENFAPIDAVYLSSKEAIEMLTVGRDCRMEFIVIDIAKSSIASEWVREEGLARIGAVEMVDLPLSELQQMIEDEFEEGGSGDVMSSFIRRLISQTSQMQKWLMKTANQIFSFSYMITTRTTSFSKLLDHVRLAAKASSHRASLDGVVFGLDSSDGSIVWRHWLGDNFAPLISSFGATEIPLFIHRSTAHYQLPGLASVVFRDFSSSAGVLVFFNPITGELVDKIHLATPISRTDVLNIVGKNHVNPLLVVGQNSQMSMENAFGRRCGHDIKIPPHRILSNFTLSCLTCSSEEQQRVYIYPPQPDEILSSAAPVYLFNVESSRISGTKVNLAEKKIIKTWASDLHLAPSEKIVIVKGKPRHQKVHSQGRVLIDRNVQYKYANPNLVAIAAIDSIHQYLSIFLVDVVSGQMIHSARLTKAAAPVHLVHCEHWIAYSYWSEKGRRTEIGVLELYEGSEQSNKDRFDSFAPTKQPPEVVSQSFIYAQGIEAMAVSETEKGLTTRSLLLALPEMREEMMIPYMPEIPVATEDMVNYNQTVHGVRGIKTAASGLESTSLMLAYGKDIFFTRLTPSGCGDKKLNGIRIDEDNLSGFIIAL